MKRKTDYEMAEKGFELLQKSNVPVVGVAILGEKPKGDCVEGEAHMFLSARKSACEQMIISLVINFLDVTLDNDNDRKHFIKGLIEQLGAFVKRCEAKDNGGVQYEN